MHEFSITSQIVSSVLDEAAERGAKKVLEVHLVIGKLTLLGIEQVRFSYNLLAEDTILKGSKLYIRQKNGRVKCERCGYEGVIGKKDDPFSHMTYPTLTCPKCGFLVKIIEGKECLIKSIKMVV